MSAVENSLHQKIVFAVIGGITLVAIIRRLSPILFAVTKPKRERKEKDYSKLPPAPKGTAPSPMVLEEKGQIKKGKTLPGASIEEFKLYELQSLKSKFKSANIQNDSRHAQNDLGSGISYNKIIGEDDFIVYDIVRKPNGKKVSEAFVRAGPRSIIHFDPKKVKAAIVTCGGLCPGLNNVIREIVFSLQHLYGVTNVMGIRGGYNGFTDPDPQYEPIVLTQQSVMDCHHQGGTILASSRGGHNVDKIIDFLVKHDINHLYVIGGDGTHRGAQLISEECIKRDLNIAVAGIPKTIDNDVDLIDRSFGFQTSVEEAQAAIVSAKTEARCNLPNGIGIVKLMGRSSGFIAVHATLASGDVDLCLVPEIPIVLEGEEGCLPFLMNRVKANGHAVIVVAEGAGEELLGQSAEVDAGGNRKLPAIGEFMKKKVTEYFAQHGMVATVKYLDPSYMIRSVAANASDALYCMLLAQNAVHGAMAGYTGFTTGLVNNRLVYIPIPRIVATSPRVMDPVGRTWERVLSMTRQPNQDPKFDPSLVSVQDRTVI